MEHERALQEYFVRTSPIGEDRFHNKYWMFSCDDSAIYVQSKSSQTSFSSNERSYKGLMPPQLSPEAKAKLADLSGSIETIRSEATDCSGATSHSNSTMIIEGVDQDRNLGVLYKLYESRPNRGEYHWHVFSTNTEIWYLYDALDDRGEREKELKAAIQARFDLKEPKEIFQTTGSAYIGRKVERQFADQVNGCIYVIENILPSSAKF